MNNFKKPPLCIAFDGPNFSGKTTIIDAVKDSLLASYNFSKNDIHVVKFGKEGRFKHEFKKFSKELEG